MAEFWGLSASQAIGPFPLSAGLPPGLAVSVQCVDGEYFAEGEFVLNGQPMSGRCPLSNGDRLATGGEEWLFRLPMESSPLLEACSIFFLFQTVGGLEAQFQAPFLSQMVEIVQSLLGQGKVRILSPDNQAELESIWPRLQRGELVEQPDRGWIAAPLLCGTTVAFVLLLETVSLTDRLRSLLTAIVTLARAGLNAGRDQRAIRIERKILAEERAERSLIVGEGSAIENLKRLIAKVAPRESTVLILGESGTGKELVARSIHQLSLRRQAPFVAINCAALTETLLESELFGFEKGSFTGANSLRIGKLELAQGGTVFLDEIGEMALSLQAKLLRVLQQRELERIGGHRVIPLDIRILAATNRDLAQHVAAGHFREDLYHRLNVVALRTPPLRERKEDIPLLVKHFMDRYSRRNGGISPAALRALMAYHWPGNIRELENAIERAMVLGDTEEIQLEDLPESILTVSPEVENSLYSMLGKSRRDAIFTAWREGQGDFREAAKLLGIHPNSLQRMIRQMGIRDELNRLSNS